MKQRREPGFGYDPRQPELPVDARAASRREPARKSSSRLRYVPIALVICVLLAFVSFLWTSYARHRHAGSGQIPVITADPMPVKVKPDQPGGMDIPFQDTTVYEELDQNKQKHGPGATEHLLQTEEEPMPKPEPEAAPAPDASAAPEAKDAPQPPATPAPADTTTPADISDKPADTNEAVLAPPPPSTATPATPAPAPAASDLLLPPPPPAKPAQHMSAAAVATPAAVPKPAASALPTPGSGPMIQLGAFRDEATASQEWQKLTAAHASELAGLSPTIERADLGPKGIWYRLKSGPLDPDEARQACVSLKAASVSCIVTGH